jgi:2-keto-3-deoxy-L-rhamnonate aldolase RhmA
MMQSMSGTGCIPLVRPQWNDIVIIKRVLDLGAYGVLVPWVNSKAEAEYAVTACRYPPQGLRGFGPRRAGMFDPDYYKTANDEILIVVQIETQKALDNLDEILAVDGIDACYIGPSDLSCSLGYGYPPKWNEPRYVEAVEYVLDRANNAGKPAGMFCTIDNIDWAIKKGFKLNTVDNADTFLIRAARQALQKARSAI